MSRVSIRVDRFYDPWDPSIATVLCPEIDLNVYAVMNAFRYYKQILLQNHTHIRTFQNALLIRVQLSTVHDVPAISFDTKCSRCRISNAFSCAQRNENTRFEIYKRAAAYTKPAHHQIRIFDMNISI